MAKLPKVNVEFASQEHAGNLSPAQVRGMICNPIYAGVGRYPALLDDEKWVEAAAQMIRKEGAEQFLVNMLFMLRKSLPE